MSIVDFFGFAIFIIVINISAWIFLFFRFKKRFSTNAIVQEARNALNSMLADLNRATERNISLIDDKIAKLKDEGKRADTLCKSVAERLSVLYGELDKLERTELLKKKIYKENALTPVSEKEYMESSSNKIRSPLDSYKKESSRFKSLTESEKQSGGDEHPVPQIPEFIKAEKPIVVKKSFKQQVFELNSLGYSVEEIARKLNKSTQEVKLTIEIS